MAHRAEQTGHSPFLSRHTQQAWAQVVEASPDRGELNMTAQLQEITTRRHRLYLIRCTLRLHAQHYHLRIAGLLPARNKMLGACRVIDPPCYRMADIPRLLQRATAQLHDGTIVHPFMSGDEETFLSLSGILFVGSTADQRYVLHEHLKNLGLAGPPAPILHWSRHLQKGPQNTHALPFRSLAMLPAELLAIPIPTTSCAFEEVPVMSLREWEEYRRRSTSTVLPMPTRCTWFRNHPMIADQISAILSVLGSLWLLVCLLISYLCKWQHNCLQLPSPRRGQPAAIALNDRNTCNTPTQRNELGGSISSHPSACSSSTELRAPHSTLRNTLHMLWSALQGANEALPVCSNSATAKVYRPTVLVRGCLPKGWHTSCLPP